MQRIITEHIPPFLLLFPSQLSYTNGKAYLSFNLYMPPGRGSEPPLEAVQLHVDSDSAECDNANRAIFSARFWLSKLAGREEKYANSIARGMNGNVTKTILLVEDEAIVAMAEAETLEEYGYKVIAVFTGEQAVATVETTPEIDLILMDINLGSGMDGTQAAEIILKQHDIPLIFLSSHTDREVVEKTKKITSYGYILKHSGPIVLIASIEMAFRLFEARIKERETGAALRESEHRFRNIVEQAPIAMAIVNMDGTIEFTNNKAIEVSGYLPEDIPNLERWWIQAYPDETYRKEVVADWMGRGQRALSEGREIDGNEHRVTCKDGSIKIMFIYGTIISDKIFVMFDDITERKRAEEVLRANESLLKESQSIARLGSYTLDIATGQWTSSEALDEVFGIDAAYGRSVEGWEALIHPGDRTMMHDYFSIDVLGHGIPFNKEYRLIRQADKAERWVHGLGRLVFDAHGRPVVMHGTIQDITDSKKAEKVLRQSESKYRALFELSADALILMESQTGRIIEANDMAVTLYGYKRDEFMTMKNTDLSAEVPESINSLEEIVTKHGEPYRVPMRLHRKKDGTIFPVEYTARLLVEDGQANVLVACRDMSQRKQMEDALRRSLEEKEVLLREIHHRVKNNMQVVASLMDLQSEINNEEARAALQDGKLRVQFMVQLHQRLHQSGDVANIGMAEFIPDIVRLVGSTYGMSNVMIQTRIDNITLDMDTTIPCGLIVNELVSNAFKHAFSGKKKEELLISMKRDGNEYELCVENTGNPLPPGFNIQGTKSLGLRLVSMLTRQLRGTLTFKSAKKTVFTLRFPMKD
jgi:PAS domain S-box-containing protein